MTLRIWGKQITFRNFFSLSSWALSRVSLVRKGRWKKSKEYHSHFHRCWLSGLQGDRRSCYVCSRWRNQMILIQMIKNFFANLLFHLHLIQSTPVSSVFTFSINERHIHFKIQEARCRSCFGGGFEGENTIFMLDKVTRSLEVDPNN